MGMLLLVAIKMLPQPKTAQQEQVSLATLIASQLSPLLVHQSICRDWIVGTIQSSSSDIPYVGGCRT